MKVICGGLTFTSDFDSGNLGKVEFVPAANKTELTDNSTSSSSSGQSYAATFSVNKSFTAEYGHDFKDKEKIKHKNRSFSNVKDNSVGKSVISSTKSYKSTLKQSTVLQKPQKVLEFKIWTKPDCGGTSYENSFRTWFHFGVEGGPPGVKLKIHLMNLNRQGKLFFYGMSPVFKVVPAKDGWRRIPGKVHYKSENEGNFTISFCHPFPMEVGAVIYFAFTYPFSYSDCQQMLDNIDKKMDSSLYCSESNLPSENAVYYCRELLCHSLDGRRVELLTITSFKGFTQEREPRLPDLFPDHSNPRCHVFCNKKVVFVSSRVHPGETPSSFVFNGLLHNLLCPKDPRANRLRHLFVFKLIPMLNPDGVCLGHYRTDTRGVNLNRTYLMANPQLYPSIYGARTMLLYYHIFYSSTKGQSSDQSALKEKHSDNFIVSQNCDTKMCGDVMGKNSENNWQDSLMANYSLPARRKISFQNCDLSCGEPINKNEPFICISAVPCDTVTNHESPISEVIFKVEVSPCPQNPAEECMSNHSVASAGNKSMDTIQHPSEHYYSEQGDTFSKLVNSPKLQRECSPERETYKAFSEAEASDADEELSCSPLLGRISRGQQQENIISDPQIKVPSLSPEESGLAFYVDLHGHASKRGCFLYGNYFPDADKKVDCMLLAKLMSINCPHFDFSSCNFSAENMRSGKHRDGQNKEGSGRVSLYSLTGIIHSYTLECNYNVGRTTASQTPAEGSSVHTNFGKSVSFFTPGMYAQVGEALLTSILDTVGHNPYSRIVCSQFCSLQGVKDWLRKYATSGHSRNSRTYNTLKTGVQENITQGCCTPASELVSNTLPLLKTPKKGTREPHLYSTTGMNFLTKPSDSNDRCPMDFQKKYQAPCVTKSPTAPADLISQLTVGSLPESSTKLASQVGKNKSIDEISDALKLKKMPSLTNQTLRKGKATIIKQKKKNVLPAFKTSDQGRQDALMKACGNLRLKRMPSNSAQSSASNMEERKSTITIGKHQKNTPLSGPQVSHTRFKRLNPNNIYSTKPKGSQRR